MAIPELEIEKKLDEIESEFGVRFERVEHAVEVLTYLLVQSEVGFPAMHGRTIARILRGDTEIASPHGVVAKVIAKSFHDTFERHVGEAGETRVAAARPWSSIPDRERNIWIAVVTELLEKGIIQA
jgi:hypothetical protein